ncbi:MAG TPA: alpha/beta hydrolase [Pyrinomonadaceae bacterium]
MFLSFVLLLVSFVSSIPADDKSSIVKSTDGVPIHYSVQGKGEPALVFIHCWSCDRHLWDNQVEVFAKTNRVVTIDLAGHGQSGQGRKAWSIESFAGDVNAVMTKLDLKRAVLVGSSMGGPIALEVTRRMPGRVVGIVAVDTLQNVEGRPTAQQLDEVMKQLRADYKGAVTGLLNQYFFSSSTPEAVKKRITTEVISRPPELSLAILEGIFAYDSAPALATVKVPIRAINGDITPTNLEVNRKYAPQFDAVIIKGSGHYPMLEHPARFNELLGDFLRSLPAARK